MSRSRKGVPIRRCDRIRSPLTYGLIRPVILHNDLAGCRWHGEGYLRCTVYYQSDEGGAKLWRTEQKYPFEKTVELPEGRYLPGPAQLWGEVEYCNCRAVSEHRVDQIGRAHV